MLEFYKYHGAGNDFIIIDNRDASFDINNTKYINLLCHRNFGIGADGILLLENHPDYDFQMHYINSDGSKGAMCGNGGRCIVDFAYRVLKIVKDPNKIKFLAVDGEHVAQILENGVRLKMQDVKEVTEENGLPFVLCGTTPHNIKFVEGLTDYPVYEEGKKIRNQTPEGVNANFVEIIGDIAHIRTYERGVENETLACGTGATSVALAIHALGKTRENFVNIKMPGGDLTVEFEYNDVEKTYKNIWLSGPATLVFKGEIQA